VLKWGKTYFDSNIYYQNISQLATKKDWKNESSIYYIIFTNSNKITCAKTLLILIKQYVCKPVFLP
jgi:hypothetical protein